MNVMELNGINSTALAGIMSAEILCSGDGKPVTGVAHDTRTIESGDLFFAIKGESFDGHQFIPTAFEKGAAGIVASTKCTEYFGENRLFLRVEDTVKAMGDLARHIQELRGNTVTVGITGSNGKTTTKELVTAALSLKSKTVKTPGNYNNFIGVPLSIFSSEPDAAFSVLEMGTSGIGEIEYLASVVRPDIALVTNVGDSHLEFLKSREGVAREKSSLYKALSPEGTGVVNADDEWASYFLEAVPGVCVTFGMENKADISGKIIESGSDGFTVRVNDTWDYSCSLTGKHNALNLLAALGVCTAAGFDPGDFTEAFTSLDIPGMRMEKRSVNGITVINDAYNANPQSMDAAFRFFREYLMPKGGNKILVCGDMRELGEHEQELHYETGRRVLPGTADILITVGALSSEIGKGALDTNPDLRVYHFASLEEAGNVLFEIAGEGDVVFLKASRGMGLERILETE